MDHFSEQAWADYVRRVDGSDGTAGIRAHLAAGCLNCRTAQEIWGRFQTIAQVESAFTPPDNLVRMAKLEFSIRQEIRQRDVDAASGVWMPAKLLFDSLTQPLLAGVRSSAASARQLIYEGDDLAVDLRFDHVKTSRKVSVTGQILDKRVPPTPLVGSPIVLWREDGVLVATTDANQYGEFQLEFELQERLRLTARVGKRRVQIRLTDPSE
jgi:hypothetical protein